MLFARPLVHQSLDVVFRQHYVLEHERIDVGHDETAIRLCGRTHDRLAADVEARVDEHRTAGALEKAREQSRESRMPDRIDGLQPYAAIDVRDRGYVRSMRVAHGRDDEH